MGINVNINKMTLIGSGAQADIYLYENKAFKIYKNNYMEDEARCEADLQKKAQRAGLPVPLVYDVTDVDGRCAIIMEYIQGKPVGEMLLENMEKAYEYLSLSVDLQIEIHKIHANGFPSQISKLENKIDSAPYLTAEQKQKLLTRLVKLPKDDKLCHGDFHILNIMQCSDGLKIIDWVDASSGSIIADVCLYYTAKISPKFILIFIAAKQISISKASLNGCRFLPAQGYVKMSLKMML
ncbi:MAG: phosphotransferase [Lachnospiraceae bacterium]|nr:phosphotransferase [Lachnospiraceae bacterium]